MSSISPLNITKSKTSINDILKLVFSGISIYLLVQCLFGKSHDVLAFYRSLFFLSYPIFLDVCDELIDIAEKKKNNEPYKTSGFVIFSFCFVFSISCFLFALIAQFANQEFVDLYNHVYNSSNWQFGILFFIIYIISFILYPLRNVVWPLIFHKNTIEVEKRPS